MWSLLLVVPVALCAFDRPKPSAPAIHPIAGAGPLAVSRLARAGLQHVVPARFAGHSKWANIKHRKGAQDKKKAMLRSKLARSVELAAKAGGLDLSTNLRLGYALDSAKRAGVPKDVIQRALSRAESGSGSALEEVVYEARGPGGVVLLVECQTDNRKRTAPLVRLALKHHEGELLPSGGASFAFSRVGHLKVPSPKPEEEEALLEQVLEAGGEEVFEEGEATVVVTPPTELDVVVRGLKAAECEVWDAELAWVPEMPVELSAEDGETLMALVEDLDDLEDVHRVWHNAV